MLAQVQTHTLFFIRNPETHDSPHYRKKNISPNDGENPSGNYRDELNPKLSRIAKEKTVISGSIYGLGSEQAGRQCSPGSANPMYSYYI